jgi:hypothetical protein
MDPGGCPSALYQWGPAVRVWVTGPGGLRRWLSGIRATSAGSGVDEFTARLTAIARQGQTVFAWEDLFEGGLTGFTWMCPRCGGMALGQIAHSEHTGWDSPRWRNTGSYERPTLTPPLDCPHCHGCYWLRDGELLPVRGGDGPDDENARAS